MDRVSRDNVPITSITLRLSCFFFNVQSRWPVHKPRKIPSNFSIDCCCEKCSLKKQNSIDFKNDFKTISTRRIFLEFVPRVYCAVKKRRTGRKKNEDKNIFTRFMVWVGLGWVGSSRLPTSPLPRLNAKFNFNQEPTINERLKRQDRLP